MYPCIQSGLQQDRELSHQDARRVSRDVPVNDSAAFAPVIQPTLDTCTQAIVVAALAWLGTS